MATTPTQSASGRTARRGSLDGLRGFAALAVVSSHLTGSIGVLPYASGGFIGVLVFFALSGYLIGAISWNAPATARSFRAFLVRRVQRLAPVMLAMVIVGVPLMVLWGQQDAGDALVNAALAVTQTTAFFVTAGMGGHPAWGPTWSLTVEWVFYLLFPLAVFAFRRRGLDAKRLRNLAAVAAIFLYLCGLLLPPRAFYLLPVANLGVMVAGASLALGHVGREVDVRQQPDPARGALALVFLILLTALPGASLGIGYKIVTLPAVGLATLVVIHSCSSASGLERALSCRPLAAVGVRAYSLYIWHMPVLWLAWVNLPGLPRGVRAAAGLTVLMPVVALSYRFLEKPWLTARGKTPEMRVNPKQGMHAEAA